MRHRRSLLVSQHIIREAARRIGANVHPEKIILFGSYATGHARPDSDVDLLVIMRSRHKQPTQRSAELSQLLEPRLFPLDLLVRTPSEIRQRLAMGDTFIREILRRGRILYDRSLRPRMDR